MKASLIAEVCLVVLSLSITDALYHHQRPSHAQCDDYDLRSCRDDTESLSFVLELFCPTCTSAKVRSYYAACFPESEANFRMAMQLCGVDYPSNDASDNGDNDSEGDNSGSGGNNGVGVMVILVVRVLEENITMEMETVLL